LELIALKGYIVTIDAMGCQYKIAEQIIEKHADYVFSLKENQETLFQDVTEYFQDIDFSHPEPDILVESTFDVGHGCLERRSYGVSGTVSRLIERHPVWKTIKSIGVVRFTQETPEKISTEYRYYISSLDLGPKHFATTARAHWGIENLLHYILDAAFREDACRIKTGCSPENWACFRKIALTAARSDKNSTDSVKSRVKQIWHGLMNILNVCSFTLLLLQNLSFLNLYALALRFFTVLSSWTLPHLMYTKISVE
jgi:predicted transposase YbfD/YdcC